MTNPKVHNLNMRRDPRSDENIALIREKNPHIQNDSDAVRYALEVAARRVK